MVYQSKIFARLSLSFLKKKKEEEKKKEKETRKEKIGNALRYTLLPFFSNELIFKSETRFFALSRPTLVIILQSGTFDKTVPHNYQANPSRSSLHNRSIMSITLTRSNYKRL